MSLINRLLGRGTQEGDHTESADYTSSQEHVSQPRNESQFMQSGRTGYQGVEHVRTYEVPAGVEQQGLAQTEGVTSPFDAQRHGVQSQHGGNKPVQVFDADETRGGRIREPLREQTTREEGLGERIVSQHETGIASDTGAATTMEQPKSPRSPRKEGMATKMKKMFKPHKYEQEREEVSSGEYADAEDVGTNIPRHTQTTDDTAATNVTSATPSHSNSAGGLSPRGNWNPTEGFNFRKSSTPPHASGRREEKAAIAVAKHDGGRSATENETPLQTSGYEGGSYDNYGDDTVPVKYDVPHSRPGRYASGEQGGAWGDHRATEVGSFRGSGMHSPSKERPPRDSQRPTWVRPGGENNPVVAAAAAAGGAAAARAATGTERGAHFSGEREGGVSGERAGLQGEADVYDPWEDPRFRESWKHIRGAGRTGSLSSSDRDNSRYERSASARDTVTDQRSTASGVPTRATSGSGFTNRAEPPSDIRDYYQSPSVHVQPVESASEERKLEREPFGSGQDIGYDNEEVGRGYDNQDGLGGDHVNQRMDRMKLDDVQGRNDLPLGSATPAREFGRRTGEQEFDFNNQGYNQVNSDMGYGNQGHVNRNKGYDATAARSSGVRGYDIQEGLASYPNGEFANQNLDNVTGKSVRSQGYSNQDITDPQTGAQNFVVGGRTEAETPYQLGERISDKDSHVRGYDRTSERSPANEQSFGVGGATTARTPHGLGKKISDKSWNEEQARGVKGNTYPQSGYGNQDVTDPQTGAQNFVVGGRTEAETPYQLGERISDKDSHVRGYDRTGEQSPGTEQSFGVGGATTAHTPYGLGEKISDKSWNEEQARGVKGNTYPQSGYGNQDVTDPQTGAQNFVVGGRTEAETPYQLGERISDKDSHVRGYDRTGERSTGTEQSFGVGGATTARTPHGLGEKISDKSWNDEHARGVKGNSYPQSGYDNQDVTDPQTGAQNFVVGGRTDAETPYQLGERISDKDSHVRGYDRTGERSPGTEQSFGVGGATTARTPYGLGEKISDKAWNEERAPGMNGNNSLRSGNGNQDVTYPQTGAQNLVSEERIESETPYRAGKRSRNQDQDSSILGREESGARSPAVAQSFGEGGATTTRSFGERTLDQPWNEERTTGLNNDGVHRFGLAAGALGAGAIGAGAVAAEHMPGRTSSEYQRSTVTGEPILNRDSEIAMGQGRAAEAPPAAVAAATQHASTEQSDMSSPYVKEGPGITTGQSGLGSLNVNAPGLATQEGVAEPPMSPRTQQYLQHGEPIKSPGLLSTAKYALGRAQNKLTNTHHHLTAGGGNISSVTGVAFGKLDVVAKRMLHGGEHLWREAFHPLPEEHLRKSFACLLSTESGAVAGVLYLSDHNLWFCSDRALQRAVKSAEADLASPPAYEQYLYKVVLPLAEVAHIESRANGRSERDKSIKVEMSGSEQFWFFGFVTFEKALINLQHAREVHGLRSASMKAGGA